jgi:hypothetical protein
MRNQVQGTDSTVRYQAYQATNEELSDHPQKRGLVSNATL